ncbi:MAG: hypothetical protein Q7V05_07475 [Methanoregula sp.]|nr:hypothetical protein [Methanoregula sp.]
MPRIADFFKTYSVKSTQGSYAAGLRAFFSFIYGISRKEKRVSPEEKVKFVQFADRYFPEE